MQVGDTHPATAGKASRTSVQKKDGKVFFTSPRVKAPAAEEQPAWPYRSGKIVLKTSAKAGGRKKPTTDWLDDDDVFSFHAED